MSPELKSKQIDYRNKAPSKRSKVVEAMLNLQYNRPKAKHKKIKSTQIRHKIV